jgi:hypothetical protein
MFSFLIVILIGLGYAQGQGLPRSPFGNLLFYDLFNVNLVCMQSSM